MRNTFYFAILLLTIVIGAAHFLVNQYFLFQWHNQYWILYVYFPSITAVIYSVLSSKIDKRPQEFVTYFMGSMSVKLFFSLALLLVVLYTVPEARPDFAVIFMVMYFFYTTLSVIILFKKLKQNSVKREQSEISKGNI